MSDKFPEYDELAEWENDEEWYDPDDPSENCPECNGSGVGDDFGTCEHCDGMGYEWWL